MLYSISLSLLLLAATASAFSSPTLSASPSTTRTESALHVSFFPSSTNAANSFFDPHNNDHLNQKSREAEHRPLQVPEQQQQRPPTTMPAGVHAPVIEINSAQELADFLQQDDRLCIIKFHAAWCKSCQRMGLKFQGLANTKTDWIADHDGQIVHHGQARFGSIEFGANTALCRKLSVERLPTVHMYRKGQQLAGFPCGPKKFPLLQQGVDEYLAKIEAETTFDQRLDQGLEMIQSTSSSSTSPASFELAGDIQDLVEQEASGSIKYMGKNNQRAKRQSPNGKKSWWNNIMP